MFFLGVADVAYSEGDPAFWRTYPEINWEESWARENKYVLGGTTFYDMRVAREDVLTLLPGCRRARLRTGSPRKPGG